MLVLLQEGTGDHDDTRSIAATPGLDGEVDGEVDQPAQGGPLQASAAAAVGAAGGLPPVTSQLPQLQQQQPPLPQLQQQQKQKPPQQQQQADAMKRQYDQASMGVAGTLNATPLPAVPQLQLLGASSADSMLALQTPGCSMGDCKQPAAVQVACSSGFAATTSSAAAESGSDVPSSSPFTG